MAAAINAEKIDAFARLMNAKLDAGDTNARKGYIYSIIDAVEVDDQAIRIIGSKDIRTLVNERIVSFSRDTKVYRLGIGLLELSRPLLNRSEFELIEPDLYQIATRFETTASVWLVLNDSRLLLLGRIAPDSHIRIEFRIATRLPLYAGATGLVVAAAHHASDDEIVEALGQIRWAVQPTPEAYLAEAKRARATGFAVDIGNLIRGVTSVATAVRDRNGRSRLVLGVHAFQGQLETDEITTLGHELHALALRAAAALYQASTSASSEEQT